MELWSTASTSDVEILERFQSKALCMIVDAHGIRFSEGIFRDQQLKKQSVATALNTTLASAQIQVTS
jgi:hypothetical protein